MPMPLKEQLAGDNGLLLVLWGRERDRGGAWESLALLLPPCNAKPDPILMHTCRGGAPKTVWLTPEQWAAAPVLV